MRREKSMKRVIRLVSQVVILLLLVAAPALAWEHHGWHYHHYYPPRVVVGFGFGPWWGPPYAPWGYYPPPYVGAYAPPVVVTQPAPAPPVYVERNDAPPADVSEPPTPGPEDAGAYWYYCPGSLGYYPKVATCPEQWVKVPARSE
jgi:hypothetical protein